MKKEFTEKDLVEFGNYLLSKERDKTIKTNKLNRKEVHNEDLCNWKDKNK